ncbi:LysE family translocator [Rhizobium oryziradicis]|uniref:Lysine transporter LysE n=1 Tax=Rhizobium oryziradicis TaxID=1867956 RepID=A0A1Q8ZQN8_9HYPH|nr:LysE family translocator [Rhizobium oryziradicis]OLP44359.1 lysine transporter LysE [Rhizobium oryziradicis]
MTPDFFVTSLIIVATPGTGVIYTLSKALSGGTKSAVVAAFGCTLGILPHMLAASLGLTALLATHETLFQLLKIAGVIYLLYMALSLWSGGTISLEHDGHQREKSGDIIVRAVLINLLNPKLSLFFLAFLPQFVPVDDQTPLRLFAIHSMIFMTLTFIVFAIYGSLAASLRRYVFTKPNVMKRIFQGFSAAFLLMSIKLAFSSR